MSFPRYPSYKDSGVEWLGEVPGHWEVVPLKHIAEFVNGDAFKPTEWATSGIPIIRIQNLNGSEDFNYYDGEVEQRYLVHDGDLLFGWSGNRGTSFGPFLWSRNEVCALNQHIFRVVPTSAEKRSLFWTLKAVTAHVEDQAHGIIGMVHVTKGDLGAINVPVPPIPEQTQIATFLDYETAKIDELVAEQRRLMELLNEEIISLVLSSFRTPATSLLRLSEASTIISRPVIQNAYESYTRIGLFNRGRGLFHKDASEMDEMGESDFFWVEEGDLIISGQFAWEGAVALADVEDTGCVVSHRYPVIRGKADVALTEYLLGLFCTKGLSEQAMISGWPVIKMLKNERISRVGRDRCGFYPSFPASRAHLACHRHQTMTRHPQIGERKQRDDLPGVLPESAIAHLGETELLLDHPERMFNDGADGRQNPVGLLLLLSEFATLGFLGRDQNGQAVFAGKVLDGAVVLVIAAISEDNALFTVQAVLEHDVVGDLGRGAFDGMDQTTLGIDADMGFHTEVPLIAFPGLTHLGIALLVLVLGGTRGSDQRSVNHRTTLHAQAFLSQHCIDLGEDGNRQFVLFQQVTEAKDGAFIRHHVLKGIQASKPAQQGNVVQRFFHGRVRVAKPLLHEVNAQHRRQRHRRTAIPFLGVERFDQRLKARPRHDHFHLRQEDRFPGLLAGFRQKSRLGKTQLFHRFHRVRGRYDNGAIISNYAA